MRIAVFSDIHGNEIAFAAALADLRQGRVDQMVCLGDAIQGGPQPREVVRTLRELGCPVVMGNSDAWLLTGEQLGKEEISPERLKKITAVREWSLAQLSKEDREFIRGFQPTVTLDTGGRQLLCFHGSPDSYDIIILPSTPEEEFQKYLGRYSAFMLTGGHTHIQHIRRIGESLYFNPGSVGFAYRHAQAESTFRADPWAEYAILSLAGATTALEFRRVPFPAEQLVRLYISTGRPYAEQDAAQYQARARPAE